MMTSWHMVYLMTAAATMNTAVSSTGTAQHLSLPGTTFDGSARTGTDTRQARFRFLCSSNNGPNVTGVLSVDMEIPGFEQLRPVFDFIPFEGPDSHAGPLTTLRTNGARATATDRFTASGSIQGTGPVEAFELDVTASRRDAKALRRLVAVLRALIDGPGQLIWRQGNPKTGGTPLIANLKLAQTQADQLRTSLGP